MWKRYITVSQLEEATEIIAAESISARIVAGATDLMLELEKGGHREVSTLVDISRVNGLNSIHIDDDGWIHLGPMVTHNSVIASSILRKFAAPLVQACWSVGSHSNRLAPVGQQIFAGYWLSLIHISEPTRLLSISYAVFCLKKKKNTRNRKYHTTLTITKVYK
mgnify:CR=1 FL=1